MSLPWFRLYRELKDDPKIGMLSDSEFRCYIESLCWACERGDGGKIGLTRMTANWAFRRDVGEVIKVLLQRQLLMEDESGELFVPSWDKRQMKSDSSSERVRKFREKQDETLQKRPCNGLEENRGEEKRKEETPIKEVADVWNESGLVKCLALNDTRKKHLNARLSESFFAENWKVAIQRISESNFCKGQNERKWKADFDWFLQPDVIAKIMEGKYDNRDGSGVVAYKPKRPKYLGRYDEHNAPKRSDWPSSSDDDFAAIQRDYQAYLKRGEEL